LNKADPDQHLLDVVPRSHQISIVYHEIRGSVSKSIVAVRGMQPPHARRSALIPCIAAGEASCQKRHSHPINRSLSAGILSESGRRSTDEARIAPFAFEYYLVNSRIETAVAAGNDERNSEVLS
jgi:hypothetical protein